MEIEKYKHATVIDNEGYITNLCILLTNGESKDYKLKDNEKIVEHADTFLLKGKYVDGKFIETATKEELYEYYNNSQM